MNSFRSAVSSHCHSEANRRPRVAPAITAPAEPFVLGVRPVDLIPIGGAISVTVRNRCHHDPGFAVLDAYVAECFAVTSRLPEWDLEYEADFVRTSPDGRALNQAVALARLGARVTPAGTDGPGRDVVAAVTREAIDVEGVQVREGAATPVCVCFVSPEGKTSFVWHIADEVAVTPDRVRAAAAVIERADAALIAFELPVPAIQEAIRPSAAGDLACGPGRRAGCAGRGGDARRAGVRRVLRRYEPPLPRPPRGVRRCHGDRRRLRGVPGGVPAHRRRGSRGCDMPGSAGQPAADGRAAG
jgi:hypothetical protein